MITIGKEATDFVRACEAIHSLLGAGLLANDDRDLIEFSGAELLGKLKPDHLTHPDTLFHEQGPSALPQGRIDCAAQ